MARKAKFASIIADQLGLEEVPEHLAPLVEQARDWARVQMDWLAQTVGGGQVGPDAGAMVQAAARMWLAHLDVFRRAAEGGDPDMYGRSAVLADKARAQILTARDLCATAAKASHERRIGDGI